MIVETPGLERERYWSNWSGNLSVKPSSVTYPETVSDVQKLITQSRRIVRPVGSGHSFSNLVGTAGDIVSLNRLKGDVYAIDETRMVARLNANKTLNELSHALNARGYAFKNLGDIDKQTLAGAISTATHGTGQGLGCLSSEVVGMTIVSATGEVIVASETQNSHLLPALRVGLGVLGVIVEVEIRVRKAFKLRRTITFEPFKDVLSDAASYWAENRGFEFYYLPFCDYAMVITTNEADGPNENIGGGDDESGLYQMRRVRNLLSGWPMLRRRLLNFVATRIPDEALVGPSFEVLATERNTRFNEIEYHMPLPNGLNALVETVNHIERALPEVFFPIEVRMTAGDRDWLSPFSDGPRMSIAVHAAAEDDYSWFFSDIEPIFRKYGGRPHWGKLHSLWYGDFFALYNDFESFWKLRRELDPHGRLLNTHLRRIFGEDGHVVS